jgi:hypothetical protein
VADDYWNARGGSYTDGGAFIFNVKRNDDGTRTLTCEDKFGRQRGVKPGKRVDLTAPIEVSGLKSRNTTALLADESGVALFDALKSAAPGEDFAELRSLCSEIVTRAQTDTERAAAINGLTLMIDRRYDVGDNKRSTILQIVNDCLIDVFEALPSIDGEPVSRYARADWETRGAVRAPAGPEEIFVVNAHDFPPEDDDCDARLVVKAYELGWRRFICYGYVGQRFLGCGFGPDSDDAIIDAYGSSGDYLASGMDGGAVVVHGNAQDQVAQIMKRGKLVVHGDVGQTFMYGAKGGSVFVKGNAAGRPLINGVGRPKAVINGTCLDFLAESFMAGDPLTGGGFVVLNGIRVDDDGKIIDLETPYPGANLFSLASGGAIYVRDPHNQLDNEQLNGGAFFDMSEQDWQVILPFLQENEELFDIPVSRLLTVNGQSLPPGKVYRKVAPAALEAAVSADDDANANSCEGSDE